MICFQGYRAVMLQTLPQLRILDCKNIFGEPINMAEINSSHLQCFEGKEVPQINGRANNINRCIPGSKSIVISLH